MMKHIKKILSMILVLCMFFSLAPVNVSAEDSTSGSGTSDTGSFYKIVHLDAGRKYFTVDWVKDLIDEMKNDGYTHLELAFGNDGLRFLLDDMSVTVGSTSYYSSTQVKAGIQAGNKAYYDAGGENEWTQDDMDAIIGYAKSAGIEIIPLLNTPGHMDAIVTAMSELGIENAAYNNSTRTVDVTNEAAVAFTQALVGKYINYFAGKGCSIFNIGADEYANDVYTGGSMGFGNLQSTGKYDEFVSYVNGLATLVKNANMTPMAFNDGIYFNNVTSSGTFDSDIMIAYWSSGWSSYPVASAQTLANKGHKMINTNGDFYYVLGKSDQWDTNGSAYAENWDNAKFMGTTFATEQAGSMFCIWCDYPNAEDEDTIYTNVVTGGILSAMSTAMGHNDSTGDGDADSGNNGDGNSDIEQNVIITDDTTGIKIDFGKSDVSEMTVKSVDSIESLKGKEYVAYDITPDKNYTKGDEAVVYIPLTEKLKDAPEDRLVGFVVNGDGTIENIKGQKDESGDYYYFSVSHFTTYGVELLDEGEIPVTENKTITVTVGQTAADTIEDADYSNNIVETELDKSIATVSVEYEQVSGGTEEVKATSITSGSSYYIKNSSGQYLSSSATWVSDINSAALWTATSSGSGYTLKNGNNYLRYQNSSLSTTTNSRDVTTWTFSNGTFSYTNRGSTYTLGDSYTVTTTDPVNATEVIFTGVTEGTTYVTVGNTRYTINVIEEDLSTVTPLTIEYWITNGRPTDADGKSSYSVSANAKEIYSENGADVTTFLPHNTAKDGRTLEYWCCRFLDKNKENSSSDGTEEQTSTSGDDETLNGTEFTKVRYWEGKWQVFTTEWVDVENNHQLVAYYMEVVNIDNSNGESELHVNTADWGTKGDGSGNWGYTPEPNRCSVSIQVVYEDGTTNPSDATAEALKSKTFVYGYWDGGRGLGTMIFNGQQNYQIYRVSAETGDMTSSTSGNYVTVTGFTWDNNEETVWEGDSTQSVSIGNPARTPSYDEPYDNLTWNMTNYNQNNAILIRIYVRAVATESALSVHYIDKTANTEFYNYNIAVKDGTTFDQNFALGDQKNTLVNNTVVNYNDVTQTVAADLSTMPEIGAQYRYSDYICVEVKQSEDGKEVYLYYTFNNVHSFVADFGLPLNITRSDLNIDGDWTSATITGAQYGSATTDATNGLTYTPDKVIQGVETLQLTLTKDDESVTHQIYIYPATTVYYEEGYANYTGTWTGTTTVNYTDKQATEIAGAKKNNYGYDDKYNDEVTASNGTQATSSTMGDLAAFTFTGTGVDVDANCSENSGVAVVQIRKATDNRMVKLATVDTKATGTYGDSVAQGAYNTPIVSVNGLTHGDYTVKTFVSSGTINLDGFRVYGTLSDEATNSVYASDKEENPSYIEMRNAVLTAKGLTADATTSSVYEQVFEATDGEIDGAIVLSGASTNDNSDADTQLTEGPKNELYLAPNQALVFNVNTQRVVQLGIKAPSGATTYKITGKDGDQTISSSTDMFYTVLEKDSSRTNTQTITITNTGENVLSITKLKVCDDPNAALGVLSEDDFSDALIALGLMEAPKSDDKTETSDSDKENESGKPTDSTEQSKPETSVKPSTPDKSKNPVITIKPATGNNASTAAKKAAQKLTVTTANKTYKVSALKKAKKTFSIGAKVKGKASLTYIVTSGKKYVTVNNNGKVTIKKNTPKGTYKIKVTAKATSKYKSATKTITIKVMK